MRRTAVLVFANSSLEEMRYKPINNGEVLFDSLTQRTLKEVQKSSLAYFHITEHHQKGNSFGERFTNAIKNVFDQGFEKVITVGNDTPHLQSGHIRAAAEALIKGRTVIGPSLDGGFYLMGIHRKDFDPKDMVNLPWQQAGLFQSILQNFEEQGCSLFRLPIFKDIDTLNDIQRLSNCIETLSSSLRRLLASCLDTIHTFLIYVEHFYTPITQQLHFNKGSPC